MAGYGFTIRADDVDLDATFGCGQCFRWERQADGSYSGVAFGRQATVSCENGGLRFSGLTSPAEEPLWRRYFDLDRDYAALRRRLSADPVLEKAVAFAPGIRLLRQEPWEALCSFILSQNNNIPRIRGMIDRLCRAYGEPAGGLNAFPAPERLSLLRKDELLSLGCGYRADYLLDAARRVACGETDLAGIETLPLAEAREELLKIKGVGPKVADCALLFGFGKFDSFPVDVWVRRVLLRFYPGGFPKELAEYGGIAQQFLFHYARCCPESGLKKA